MGRSPIRHDDSIEAPFFFHNGVVEVAVLGHECAVHQVVGIHERADLGLLHRGFKGRQIDLAQCPFVHVGTVIHASVFHVVSGEVFCGGDHLLRLNAFNDGNRHPRG